ncbi:MAG: transposase [Planctomycetaceae bacterium]
MSKKTSRSAAGPGSPRRRHTAEFKQQAVQMVTQQGLSLAEVARRLGVHENLLRNSEEVLREARHVVIVLSSAISPGSGTDASAGRERAVMNGAGHFKKPLCSSRRSRDEIRLHPGASEKPG